MIMVGGLALSNNFYLLTKRQAKQQPLLCLYEFILCLSTFLSNGHSREGVKEPF